MEDVFASADHDDLERPQEEGARSLATYLLDKVLAESIVVRLELGVRSEVTSIIVMEVPREGCLSLSSGDRTYQSSSGKK